MILREYISILVEGNQEKIPVSQLQVGDIIYLPASPEELRKHDEYDKVLKVRTKPGKLTRGGSRGRTAPDDLIYIITTINMENVPDWEDDTDFHHDQQFNADEEVIIAPRQQQNLF